MTARRNHRGKWIVDILYTHPDGRRERIQKTSPVQTKRGAEAFERQLRQALLDGTFNQEEEKKEQKKESTLKSFSAEFMETYVRTNNRQSEQEGKSWVLRRYLLPRFGSRRLGDITVRDIERLKAELTPILAPRTVNNILTVLRKILRYAVEVEELDKVPRFKLMKVPPQPYSFLDFDEFEALVAAAQKNDPQLALALLLGGEAGLRRGELAGLKWIDVSFPLNKLTVMRELWRGKELPPKSGRSRTVPLTERLAAALRAHRNLVSDHVLVRDGNEPWTVEVFRWQGQKAYRLAGLPSPRFPWHTLRHTFCSHLAMRGAPVRAIQDLAGHSELSTTMRYMHLSPATLVSAIDLLNNATLMQPKIAGKKKASVSAGFDDDPTGT